MSQKIFKNAYTEKLKKNLLKPGGVDRYLNGDIEHPEDGTWIKRDLKDVTASGFALKNPVGSTTNDVDNAIALFEELKTMTPTQATDHRLWAYLCHVPFMEFLRKRRPIGDQPEKQRAQFILEHWFVENPGPAAFKSNDIYLFWWGPYITYDKDREDPFELTRELFSMLDYTRHLLSGYQGRSRDFTHAVLEYVVENPHLFSKNKEARIRFIMRRLNLVAGYRALATLGKAEIKKLIGKYESEIAVTENPKSIRKVSAVN